MNRLLVLWFFVFLLIGSACNTYELPSVGAEVGSISGTLNLYDEGTTIMGFSGGVKISLEGTDPLIYTFSDEFGRFEFKRVPFGSYVVIYEKEGYGTFRYLGEEDDGKFEHRSEVVNSKIPHFELGEKSTTQIRDVSYEKIAGGYQFIVTTDPGASQSGARYITFFTSPNPEVDKENFEIIFTHWDYSNPQSLFISDGTFENMLDQVSGKGYMRVYGDSYLANHYFENGKHVRPNLNPESSEVILLERK